MRGIDAMCEVEGVEEHENFVHWGAEHKGQMGEVEALLPSP